VIAVRPSDGGVTLYPEVLKMGLDADGCVLLAASEPGIPDVAVSLGDVETARAVADLICRFADSLSAPDDASALTTPPTTPTTPTPRDVFGGGQR